MRIIYRMLPLGAPIAVVAETNPNYLQANDRRPTIRDTAIAYYPYAGSPGTPSRLGPAQQIPGQTIISRIENMLTSQFVEA